MHETVEPFRVRPALARLSGNLSPSVRAASAAGSAARVLRPVVAAAPRHSPHSQSSPAPSSRAQRPCEPDLPDHHQVCARPQHGRGSERGQFLCPPLCLSAGLRTRAPSLRGTPLCSMGRVVRCRKRGARGRLSSARGLPKLFLLSTPTSLIPHPSQVSFGACAAFFLFRHGGMQGERRPRVLFEGGARACAARTLARLSPRPSSSARPVPPNAWDARLVSGRGTTRGDF